jgi:copper transport protein
MPICVGTMVVTGALQAWRVMKDAAVLTDSDYGRAFLGKMALVLLVLILGVIASTVVRRVGVGSATRLLAAQAVLGVAVLGVSAGLVSLAPEATVALAPATVSVASGSLTAIVTVTPAHVGSVDVHVVVSEPDAVTPTSDLTMSISLPERGLGEVAVPLAPDGPDHYSAFGVNIPVAGTWSLSLDLTRGDGTTVHLASSVRIAG